MCIQNNAKSMSGLELQGSETNVLESFDSFDSLKEELKKWNVSLEFDSFQKLRRLGNKIVISQTFNHDALLSKITSKENMNKDIEEVDGPYVVIDLENYTIETDFLGIQPLFYSQNKMKISEMPEEDMIQIEPQKKVIFGNEGNGKIEFEDRAVPKTRIEKELTSPYASEKDIAQTLASLFEKAVSERLKNISKGEKVGLMLSGGVDSSTLAVTLSKLGVKFTAYTICTEQSIDLEYARHLTSSLGIPHEEVKIEKNALGAKMREVLKVIRLKEYRRSTPVFLPVISGLAAIYYFAFERASNQGIKWMFSGVGSEEIFAGFVDRTNEDLNIQCKRRLHTIYHRDLYRDFAIAKHFGIRTVAPFLDIDFAYYALDIPPYLKVCKGYKKYIWRCASEIIGTPKKNCWRQNKATQYGSGIDRLVTQLAKESGLVYKKKYIEWLIDGKELPSEKIEIRVVDLSHDWASLKRLVHQVLHEHGFDFKTSKVKNEICNIPSLYLDDGTFLVAVCNDKCIGTIGIRKKDGKEKDCVLENMYIQKHFRSRGLGTRLFNAALDFAKEMTFSRMYVSVHDKYSKGKIFFEKRGFVKIGRNKNEDVYELKLK